MLPFNWEENIGLIDDFIFILQQKNGYEKCSVAGLYCPHSN